MNHIKELIQFLNTLEEKKIYYRINKTRTSSIMIEVTIPGQRWEIEFMDDGSVEIEKFVSNGEMYSKEELVVLLNEFSD